MLHRLFLPAIFLIALIASPALGQDSGPSKYWFKVDAINPGLGEAPRTLDRETPQATLEAMLFATASKDYERAAHLLDLREIPENIRASVAPELARKLRVILDRRVWVDWESLPDRPDGLSGGSTKEAMSGEPRRSLRMTTVDLQGRPVSIRMNRLKPENGDPVWLFSRQSVENIDALYKLYGPSALEQAMPESLKTELFLGLQVWELFALPILLLAAAFAGIGTYKLISRVSDSSDHSRMSAIAEAVRLPLALVAGGSVAYAALQYVISFNGAVNLFLDPLVIALFVIAAALLLIRVVDALMGYALDHSSDDIDTIDARAERDFYTNISGARRLITIIVLLAGVGYVMSSTSLMQNLGFAALGGASVLALILVFAGRAALSNIMASLQIAFSKPARIGDTLIFEDQWCTVKRIHFTYVELEVWDGRLLIVPVNNFVTESFQNMTKYDPKLIRTVFLTLDHRAPVDRLRDAFLAFIKDDERIVDFDMAGVEVFGHTRDGIEVRFKMNTVNPSEGWEYTMEVREHLLNVARDIEKMTGKPVLPVEREIVAEVESRDRLTV